MVLLSPQVVLPTCRRSGTSQGLRRRLRARGARGSGREGSGENSRQKKSKSPQGGGSKEHGRRAAQRVLCRMSYSVWSAEEVIHATKWIQCCDHGVTPQRSPRRLRRSEPSLCDRPATLCIS